MSEERLGYTAKEVAIMLGRNERSVTRMALNGELPALRLGGRWLFPKRKLEAFLNGELELEAVESGRRAG